jgi:hypothetical protein
MTSFLRLFQSFLVFVLLFSLLHALPDDQRREELFRHAAFKACEGRDGACSFFFEQFKKSVLEKDSTTVLNAKTASELGLFAVRGKAGTGLIEKLPCITEAGRTYAALKLAFPSDNAEEIRRSQRVVEELAKQPELAQQIREKLHKLQTLEHNVAVTTGHVQGDDAFKQFGFPLESSKSESWVLTKSVWNDPLAKQAVQLTFFFTIAAAAALIYNCNSQQHINAKGPSLSNLVY